METPNIIGVHVQRVEDDCVYYETAYAVSDELHEQVAESLNYGDNWSLTCLGAVPSSKMNSGGTSNWLMERNLSGDNHWLEDLAQRHATVDPESAGMETRLLQEIARLQDELKATSYLLGRYEECINAIWSASSLRMAHKYIAILRNGNKP